MHHHASQFDDGLKIRYSNSKKYYVKLDEYKIDSIPASIPSLQKKAIMYHYTSQNDDGMKIYSSNDKTNYVVMILMKSQFRWL